MNLSYLYVFFQSNFLEWPIYWFVYRILAGSSEPRVGFLRIGAVVFLANSLTHPIVFFGFMGAGFGVLASLLSAEIFAILSETFLHGRALGFRFRDSLVAAVVANLVSWQFGPVLTYAFITRLSIAG